MSNSKVFFRSGLFALAIIFIIPCVSAWSFTSWAGPSSQDTLTPGSPVTASWKMSFSSFETGKTFPPDDSLVMFTGLSNPQWVVTMTETVDDKEISSILANRQTTQVRLDSWTLSASRKQFDLNVKLTGTVPQYNESQEIIVLRLEERDPNAAVVKGTQTKKTAQVVVSTPVPTVMPTTMQTPEAVLVITPEPTESEMPVQTQIPMKKQTYAPGPDPLLICGMLAGLVLVVGLTRRKT